VHENVIVRRKWCPKHNWVILRWCCYDTTTSIQMFYV